MRPSFRNLVWLSQQAGTIPGGGGGGGYWPVTWTPPGGAYTPGMEITAAWDSAPEGTASVLVRRFYSADGEPPFLDKGSYLHESPVSPFVFTSEAHDDIDPGGTILFVAYFYSATPTILDSSAQALFEY